MTTVLLFAEDAYRRAASAKVMGLTGEGGVILDASVFYPRGGGQPGDSGRLIWSGGKLEVATAVKGEGGAVVLLAAEPEALPEIGAEVEQHLHWERRFGHMRIHTALHLLSVVLPFPVTGGAIAADKGRLDFLMPSDVDSKDIIAGKLNTLVERDLAVSETWISETELEAQPELVKTLSVMPPKGAGRIRLVQIGEGAAQVDLQPCGGTHVRSTGEIGKLEVRKIENKGKQNRRVTIGFASDP